MNFFITYGDHKFIKSKKRITEEAKNLGIFDEVISYGPEDLPRDFVEATTPVIQMSRMAGYGLWKAYLWKSLLERMTEKDICVYADAGCTIRPNTAEYFLRFFSKLLKHDSGIAAFRYKKGAGVCWEGIGSFQFTEEVWTNEKIFEYFKINKDNNFIRKTEQFWGGMLVFCKKPNSINVINRFYNIAIEWPDLFSDLWNPYKKSPEFYDNRHDQSILSILLKLNGCYLPICEGGCELNPEFEFPIWGSRIRE